MREDVCRNLEGWGLQLLVIKVGNNYWWMEVGQDSGEPIDYATSISTARSLVQRAFGCMRGGSCLNVLQLLGYNKTVSPPASWKTSFLSSSSFSSSVPLEGRVDETVEYETFLFPQRPFRSFNGLPATLPHVPRKTFDWILRVPPEKWLRSPFLLHDSYKGPFFLFGIFLNPLAVGNPHRLSGLWPAGSNGIGPSLGVFQLDAWPRVTSKYQDPRQ